MAAPLPKRIIKETERLQNEPVPGISATPHDDNARYFDVVVEGPGGSCYEGGVFQLELFLPDDYPMCPPRIRFLTRIYHPNIDRLGRICLDVLKNNWSPALQIRTILLSIQALLGAPNPEDPLNEAVAKQWKENQPEAIKTAREWTTLDTQHAENALHFTCPQGTYCIAAATRPHDFDIIHVAYTWHRAALGGWNAAICARTSENGPTFAPSSRTPVAEPIRGVVFTMFALPQATTSAVAAARDGEKRTPNKNDDSRHSLYGSGGRPHPTTPTNMPPKTPQSTPEDDAAFSSTVGAASGTDEAARTWRDIRASGGSYQVSISAGSSSSSSAQRQPGGEGEAGGVKKKKKSFMQALGLRSRKSSSALNRSVSAETWETTGTGDFFTGSTNDIPPLPTSPAPTSSSTATRLLTRKRGKSSPKPPQAQHLLQGQDSMASMMSTDSVSSVATVSPFGRSPHLPTPLRVSTTTDAAANPPIDPHEPLPGVVSGDRAELPLRLAPAHAPAPAPGKGKKKQEVSNFSSPTPAYYRERSERWLADRYPVDDDGREIASPIGPPVPEKRRMPDEQAMREAEEQAREWSRYVESVKQEVQRQREREAQDPLGPAPHTGTTEEMDDYEARQQVRTEDKVKLAKQFVHRTSTYGLMLKDGNQSNEPQDVSVYDVLADWEKNHAKGDPQMRETVVKRLFKRVKRQFSSPSLKPPLATDPNTPIITEREVKKEEEGEQGEVSQDDASDQPLASTPDEEHYQIKGLGIASPSTSGFDYIPPKHPARMAALEAKLAKEAEETARTGSSLKAPQDANSSQSTTPTGPSSVRTVVPKGRSSKRSTPSGRSPGHRSNYIMSPTLPSVPAPLTLHHQEQSGWETDDEVDIDDDLMEAAKASGSTPDQRQKFRDEQEFSAMLDRFPTPPMFAPDLRAKLEKEGKLPPLQVSQVGRKNSTLIVKRDPTSRAFSPQLDTHEQQAEFEQNIQAAAQRRTEKLSKVPVSVHHPALRLDTGDDFAPRSSSLSMQMQMAKTRPSNIPTPTKAKPVKPAKPSKLAAHSTLRGVAEEQESPPEVRAQIPRPPKYGQHISPGKGLESPEAQNSKSPVEQHMDNVAAAWQGPRTPSLASKPNFDSSPSMQEAQEMRCRFGLPLLEFKREGEPPHPNHRYAWDTQNLMCQGIHRGAYEPLDASSSFSSTSEAAEASPLRRFATTTSSSAVLPAPAASHDTFSSLDINFEGKSCHHCHRTCCFYTEQLAVLNIGFARDEAVRVAVEKARAAEYQLRKAFPGGVERFDAHMKCSECGVVCCHQHGVVCSTLSCRAALCERCARWLGGACGRHGGGEGEEVNF
ncbi:hypothetical protein BST61_g9461 [Cercospora zeina]